MLQRNPPDQEDWPRHSPHLPSMCIAWLLRTWVLQDTGEFVAKSSKMNTRRAKVCQPKGQRLAHSFLSSWNVKLRMELNRLKLNWTFSFWVELLCHFCVNMFATGAFFLFFLFYSSIFILCLFHFPSCAFVFHFLSYFLLEMTRTSLTLKEFFSHIWCKDADTKTHVKPTLTVVLLTRRSFCPLK